MTLSISHDDGTAFAVRDDDDVELFRYTYVPDTAAARVAEAVPASDPHALRATW